MNYFKINNDNTKTKLASTRLLSLVGSLSIALLAYGCDVSSGGKDTGGLGGMGGDSAEDPRGFVVVNTDYESASVSLIDIDGEVISESFISSSSAGAGLSAALSGDVVLPSTPVSGKELVLIDRAGVLSWVNLADAEVRAQLSVATGFSSNPHDYVPVSQTLAYVTRFGGNANAGKESFDAGNDVLVIDPSVPEITARIDLGPVVKDENDGILPRADRAVMAGGKLRVLSVAISADFTEQAESRLVTIDPQTNRIADIAIIEGMSNCGGLSLSPVGHQLAIACNGAYGQDPVDGFPDSGIVIFDTSDEPEELARFAASALGGEQLGTVEFATSTVVAYITVGRYNEDRSAMAAPDTVRLLDLEMSKGGDAVLETEDEPFQFGDVRCIPSELVCLVTDAETDGGVVQRLRLNADGALQDVQTLKADRRLGLPPRYLGEF